MDFGVRVGSILLVFMLLTSGASAVSLGISPSLLELDEVLKGGYGEKTTTISTSSQTPLDITITVGGDIHEWVTVSETNFILDPNSRKRISVVVRPPMDTPNGVYTGYVIASSRPSKTQDVMGATIVTAVEMKVNVKITGTQNLDFAVTSAGVKDTEEGQPIEFNFDVENLGNVFLDPNLHIDIRSGDGTVVKSINPPIKEVKPTTFETYVISVPNDLPLGDYTAIATINAGDKSVKKDLSFSVLERGSLRLQGELITISTDKVWANVGDVIEIVGVFKNKGQLVAPAVFHGKVYLDGTLVDVIKGDEIDVAVGETSDLKAFYKPERPGRYKIIGWVYYSKKTTKEKFVILNVQEAEVSAEEKIPDAVKYIEEEEGQTTLYLVIGALVAVILVLVVRGRK